MCGIIAVVGPETAASLALDGLCRLECRGYDSAGIGLVPTDPAAPVPFFVRKRVGMPTALREELRSEPLPAAIVAIGHTRWSTHGAVTEANAHPHVSAHGGVLVVHNGTVPTGFCRALREELQAAGYAFRSETDTEIIANLIERARREGGLRPMEAVLAVARRLEECGATFALVVAFADAGSRLYALAREMPLVIGFDAPGGATYLASEVEAVPGHVSRFAFLRSGEAAEVGAVGVEASVTFGGRPVVLEEVRIERDSADASADPDLAEAHAMLREIREIPAVLRRFLDSLPTQFDVPMFRALVDFVGFRRPRVVLAGCGSAYHACLGGADAFRDLVGLEARAVLASDFTAADAGPDDLFVAVSQSGTTYDTIEALKLAQARGARTVAVVNRPHTELARLADVALLLHAGTEDGVAATKSFVAQGAALAALALACRGTSDPVGAEAARQLDALPVLAARALDLQDLVPELAKQALAPTRRIICLGQGPLLSIAREAALKIVETAYLDAHAVPTAELKHGPLALLDGRTAVLAFFPQDSVRRERALLNLSEIGSREHGPIVVIATESSSSFLREVADEAYLVPDAPSWLVPLLQAIPAQLFAYYTAVALGNNPDRPRNLAKTVTVG